MRRNATTAFARDNQFAIMSPTEHCASEKATEHTRVGDLDVGDARETYWRLYVDWFDHWLKGAQNGIESRPKVQYCLAINFPFGHTTSSPSTRGESNSWKRVVRQLGLSKVTVHPLRTVF